MQKSDITKYKSKEFFFQNSNKHIGIRDVLKNYAVSTI